MSFPPASLGTKAEIRGPTVFDELVVTVNNYTPTSSNDVPTKEYTDNVINIPDNSIDTADISDLAVTSAKIGTSAVTTAKLVDLSVTTAKLAANTVSTANIADNAVTTALIATSGVDTSSINDLAVTTDIIANSTLTGTNFAVESITGAKLATDSVTEAKIATGAVQTDAIANGAVTNTILGANVVTTAKIQDGAVTSAKVANASVFTSPTLITPRVNESFTFPEPGAGLGWYWFSSTALAENFAVAQTLDYGGFYMNNRNSTAESSTFNALTLRDFGVASTDINCKFCARDKWANVELYHYTGATKNFIRSFRNATGSTFIVDVNGSVTNFTGTYGTISDRRLKKGIRPAHSQWEDFKAIQFVHYNFKKDPKTPINGDTEDLEHDLTIRQLGVIAQQLERAGMKQLVETKDGVKNVKYSILMLKGVGVLQEAMQRIEALEARFAPATT